MNITPIIVTIEKLMKNYQDDGRGRRTWMKQHPSASKNSRKKNIPYQKHEASVRDVLRKFSLGLMTLEGRPHGPPLPSAGPRLSHPCPERAIAVVLAARAGVFRAWHPA